MTISLYLSNEYDKNSKDVISLIKEVRGVSSELQVHYKDKDEVLADIKEKDLELVRILEDDNPLPNTITISEVPLSLYDELNHILSGRMYLYSESNASEINKSNTYSDYKSQYERIEKVTTVLQTLGAGLYAVILVFLVSIGIIIYSIIGNFIYYYRDEIYITRLVGGSKKFIYGPFSLQGVIYSVISYFVSVLVFLIIIQNVAIFFEKTYSVGFLYNNIVPILLLELLVFILIGALSGYYSSKKYLK